MKKRFSHHLLIATGILMCLLYIIPLFGGRIADVMWGTHFMAFLPLWQVIFWLLLAGGIGLWAGFGKSLNFKYLDSKYIPLALASLMGLLFYAFPLSHDGYGDATYWADFASSTVNSYNSKWKNLILDPNIFHPKVGERTLLNLVAFLSYITEVEVREVFRVFDALCGALFVGLWVGMVRQKINSHHRQWLFIGIGLTAPFLLNFYGHIEIYSPTLVALLAFGIGLDRFFEQKTSRSLIILTLLWLLNMKFHISAVLLTPALLLSIVYYFSENTPFQQRFFRLKNLSIWVLGPLVLLGLFGYFILLEDHVDPRTITLDTDIKERLFLPLFSPDAPLDRYNLLSVNHLLDYLNLMLLWGSAAWFLAVLAIRKWRAKIDWNRPVLMLLAISLGAYSAFFFMANPLIGMPLDWDLFSLPAPLFLLLILMIYNQLQEVKLGKMQVLISVVLVVLSCAGFFLHQQKGSLAKRYISMGKHTFRTYWIRSTEDINFGLTLLAENQSPEAGIDLRKNIAQELVTYAVEGKDVEYAELLKDLAVDYKTVKQDFAQAHLYLEQAKSYASNYGPIHLVALETFFLDGKLNPALEEAERLVELQYPSLEQALRIGIHIALEAEAYEKAVAYCKAYLDIQADDPIIQQVYRRLLEGDRVGELKMLFSGGS